jgi:hypothetical protein
MSPPSSGSNKPKRQHKAGSKKSSACYLLYAGFLLGSLFDPEDMYVPPKRRLNFTGLDDVISQNIGLSMITAAITPTRT